LLISSCGPGQLLGQTLAPTPTVTPALTATNTPTNTPTSTPTQTPLPSTATPYVPLDQTETASATLPVRGSGGEFGLGVLMAPGPDGTLFVAIPRPGGSVLLVLLDPAGRPRAGWPVLLADITSCGLLLPVEDGSVRALCSHKSLDGSMYSSTTTFAFDSKGSLLAGFPVELRGYDFKGRVVGDELTLFVSRPLTEFLEEGKPSHDGGLVTVAADGALRSGARVPVFETCCIEEWAVGPDGVAYGVMSAGGWGDGSAEMSQITALDLDGVRRGWPVKIDRIASGPAFGPGGQIVVTVGSFVRSASRVLAFDRDGKAVPTSSPELPIATAELRSDCSAGANPRPPLVAQDGTIFVFSEIDTAVYALDPSLQGMRGWPYRPATPLVSRPLDYGAELSCSTLVRPAAGPDSVLYLALQARDATVGGSIVAVGPDGRVRPGWPFELQRPGAELWSVVVGSDGTAYALAIEPETGDASSASILAIAPDSTVLYRTTIIEP